MTKAFDTDGYDYKKIANKIGNECDVRHSELPRRLRGRLSDH